jgi:predicted permease
LKAHPGEDSRGAGRGFFFVRNGLVVGQVALSLALLVAAGLIGRSAYNAMHFDPGFNLDAGILAELDAGLVGYSEEQTRQRYAELVGRIEQLPGVESVSLAATIPLGEIRLGEGVQLAGVPFPAPPNATSPAEGQSIGAGLNVVGADYFKTLGIPLMRGREFTKSEMQTGPGSRVAVINSVLARQLWPEGDAVGRQLQIGAGGEQQPTTTVLEIVGVVPPQKYELFEGDASPMLYLPYGQRFFGAMMLHVRAQPTARLDALLNETKATIQQLDARLPVLKAQTLQFHMGTNVQTWVMRAGAYLFGALGMTALLLAMLGVYGVKAYAVARRTREIGIRMALGSSTQNVLTLFLRDGVKLTVIGLLIGGVLAVGVATGMGSMLYEVNRFDPFVLIAAATCLALASLAACWIPARRAARIDPMKALRTE